MPLGCGQGGGGSAEPGPGAVKGADSGPVDQDLVRRRRVLSRDTPTPTPVTAQDRQTLLALLRCQASV